MNKVITRLTTLDGNATVTALQSNLCELTQYAIKKMAILTTYYFNQSYVQLKVQGQLVDDVNTILFDAYLQAFQMSHSIIR